MALLPSIFINFRRADTDETAFHLDTGLRQKFGESEVFRDQRTMDGGAHFPSELERHVAACQVMLAVMGPRWASVTNASGRRCIDDENDWVRREIALALRWNRKVIPVLIDHDRLPREHELPDDIKGLILSQAFEFRPRKDHLDFPHLFEEIGKAVPGLRRATRARAGASGGQSITTGPVRGGIVTLGGRGNKNSVLNGVDDPDEHGEDDLEDEFDDEGRP